MQVCSDAEMEMEPSRFARVASPSNDAQTRLEYDLYL